MEAKAAVGYCAKCKKTSPMVEKVEKVNTRGMLMNMGKCEVCGTKMCRIIGKAK